MNTTPVSNSGIRARLPMRAADPNDEILRHYQEVEGKKPEKPSDLTDHADNCPDCWSHNKRQ